MSWALPAFHAGATTDTPPPMGPRERSQAQLRLRLRKPRSPFRRGKEFAIEKLLFLCGAVSTLAIILIFVFLFKEGAAALQTLKATELIYSIDPVFQYDAALDQTVQVGTKTDMIWQPVSNMARFSVLPLIWGSFLVALLASLFSTFAGIGVGIFLSEMSTKRVRGWVKPALELLVGIPTVVIGFFMLAVIALPLKAAADAVGLAGTYRDLYNAFVAALGVSIVIIPVVGSLVDDALRAVPDELRAASLGLGATRWQTTWRAVVPAGVSGVWAAVILGFGRALGETMIVVMCAGGAAQIVANPFSSVRTMTATIAAEMGSAQHGGLHAQTLFLVGAMLVTLTFFLNLIAEVIVNRYRRNIRH